MKELRSTSSTSSLCCKFKLRGIFASLQKGDLGIFHRTVKCTYLIGIAAEFAVVASNYGCHILKVSMVKEDTLLSTSVSQSCSEKHMLFPAAFFFF